MTPAEAEALWEGAAALGVPLDDGRLRQFERYAELLAEWNERLNLTRIPSAEVGPLHFLDSLAVSRVVDLAGVRRLVDVGTGAGFPGLPLKIAWPTVAADLLDSTRKKLAFVDAVIADLGLQGAHTVHARAEEAARTHRRESYDLVVARAVARMNVLAEWLLPFARPGGHVVALKGAGVEAEVAEARGAVRLLGGGPPRVVRVALPGTDIERALVVIRKEHPTPARYPRAGGLVKAHPLR